MFYHKLHCKRFLTERSNSLHKQNLNVLEKNIEEFFYSTKTVTEKAKRKTKINLGVVIKCDGEIDKYTGIDKCTVIDINSLDDLFYRMPTFLTQCRKQSNNSRFQLYIAEKYTSTIILNR